MATGVVFERQFARDVIKATKITLATHGKIREARGPRDSAQGGGCDAQNAKVDVSCVGKPTGGTFDLILTINAVTDTLTFNYNDNAAAIKTELETHPEIASNEVSVTGDFPNSTVRIEFLLTLAEKDIALPRAEWGSLTGGTGVTVICALAQKGHA